MRSYIENDSENEETTSIKSKFKCESCNFWTEKVRKTHMLNTYSKP